MAPPSRKPDNILVNASMDAKISDFGESKLMDAALTAISMSRVRKAETATIVGTANYIDPRVARGDAYEELCDVFSFGVILFEALCAKVGGGFSFTIAPIMSCPVLSRFALIPTAFSQRITRVREERAKADGVQAGKAAPGIASLHMRGERVKFPAEVAAQYSAEAELVELCWSEDANARPSSREIVKTLEDLSDGAPVASFAVSFAR